MAQNDGTLIPGSGTPAPGGNDSTPNSTPNVAPSTTPTGGAPGTGGAPAAKSYTYAEDRSDWRPAHRFNEESTKRQAAERRLAQLEQELETREQRIRALAGVGPKPTDEEAKEQEIKGLLVKMFPHLESLKDFDPQQLQAALRAGQQAEEASVQQWARHADTMVNDLESEVAAAIGVDKLTPTQAETLRQAYVRNAQQSVNERFQRVGNQWVLREGYDFSNDFMSRHEKGDKSLIKEFAKAFVGDWFEPARRHVTSQVTRRLSRPVPSGSRSGQPITKTPEINYNDPDAFKKALLEARRGSGE